MLYGFIEYVDNVLMYYVPRLASGNWKVKTALFICFLSLLTSFPEILVDTKPMDKFAISAIQWQIDNPLKAFPSKFIKLKGKYDILKGSKAHIEKRNTRIVIPLIAHFLHLNIWFVMTFQILIAMLFIYFAILIIYEVTEDKILTILFVTMFSCTLAGKWPFHSDLYFDGHAMFFLMLSIYFRNPLLVFLFIILAAFTDERAFIGSSFVLLWHQFRLNNFKYNSNIFSVNKVSLTIIFTWITYVILRLLLLKYLNIKTPVQLVGLDIILINLNLLPLSFILIFGAGWVIVFIVLYKMYKNKNFVNLFAIVLAFFISLIVALSVYDVGRSSVYCFILLILSFAILVNNEYKDEFRKDLSLLTILCFVIPTHFVFVKQVFWLSPVFPKILKLII